MCEKSNKTDVMVEQSLLDNIDLTLDASRPTLEGLGETHLAVIAYKEFQEALLIKSERLKIIRVDHEMIKASIRKAVDKIRPDHEKD